MESYTLLLQNKELFKIVYALIILFICAVIVFKTDKLFRLSFHKGIQYFRNAFFFFGTGFFLRYVFGSPFFYGTFFSTYYYLIGSVFKYFLLMGGFFLLYSLLWKKIESSETHYRSSILNAKILIFHIMAIVIVVLDYIWQTHSFMFFSQILTFAFASIISYSNLRKKSHKHKFPKFYFIAMLLGFFAWVLNAVAELYFNWSQGVLINVYILNLIFFLLFLYGVFRATNSNH